ncbi:MAG TPA: bifunctional hydroxymethylpyrimidine kinase/phosphomethylpyrimidine kinase, partial [Candidatus Acidoferrales bacterium]|nr:bifunctional hydroxymethylpyrimidine kinase/phosphomethylpyrimidine kinase [Candidatus Acidoferrales bacterium]
PTPAPTLRAQLDALADDCTIAAVKIGMLGTKANAVAVAEFLDKHKFVHVVLDPVTKPTAGMAELIDESGLKFLRDEFIRRATLITPNIPEAELLAGIPVKDVNDMKAAALKLAEQGAKAVIVTGGHLEKPVDVLLEGGVVSPLAGEAVKSENTHGSGCTFSSAIAAQLALGQQLHEAAILAKAYVTKAIEKSFSIGKGHGPLNHFFRFYQEPPTRGVHEVPQHGLHPAAEPAAH